MALEGRAGQVGQFSLETAALPPTYFCLAGRGKKIDWLTDWQRGGLIKVPTVLLGLSNPYLARSRNTLFSHAGWLARIDASALFLVCLPTSGKQYSM